MAVSPNSQSQGTYLELVYITISIPCSNLPVVLISRRLSCLCLPGNLHLDPGTPGSQVATVLGRIRFRKTYPQGNPPIEMEGSLLVVGLCLVSAVT